MAEINDLSVTDASNTARFPEDQLPSTVNNGARALEGIIARWHKDTNASISSGGTGDVITLAATQTLSAYYDGLVIAFDATAANTTAATLNVDAVGAAAIKKHGSADLVANDIKAGQKVIVIYDGTNWQMVSQLGNAPSAGLANVVEDTTPQLGGDLDANGNQIKWAKGADVASAAALPVLTDGNYFDVTGTTTITSIDTCGGDGTIVPVIKLHFDGALTLTHHATDLILPGGANITTAAGDEAEFVEYAAGDWRCTNYTKASGKAVVTGVFESALLHVRDEKTSGTQGGGASATTNHTRTLNTVVTNEISGASLGSNQITLPAGTYYIEASAPAGKTNQHKGFLYNVTDTADELIGTAESAAAAAAVYNRTFIRGRFTIAGTKTFEVRHYTTAAAATNGLGVATATGQVEVYTDVQIWKVG